MKVHKVSGTYPHNGVACGTRWWTVDSAGAWRYVTCKRCLKKRKEAGR